MSKDKPTKRFQNYQLKTQEKTLDDFFKIRGGTLTVLGPMQTENFISGKRGVQLRNEGLNAGSLNVAGAEIGGDATLIPGALTHTGGTAGFFNTAPVSQQSHTMGNTNGEIGGLTISAGYDQAEVQALRDKTEELADDVRAIYAALQAYGLLS